MKRKSSTPSKPGVRKTKSKSKSKGKDKRFDPLQYLNSLIEGIHDQPHNTTRRKGQSSVKRDLASAMAHTTPYSQRTAASSKVRCRSSYSQYRKKSVTLKDALKIDLNAVTQDDYIQFTQNTVKQSQLIQKHEPIQVLGMSRGAAARKIQRAWRNFQTLKVVRKYYEYYRGALKKQEQVRQIESNQKFQEQSTIKKDFEHTLKIRREDHHRNSPNTTLRLHKPVIRSLDYTDELVHLSTKEMKRDGYNLQDGELETIELPVLKDNEIKEYGSKDLNFIMNLFKNSQEIAARDVEEQLSAFCKAQADLAISSQMSTSKVEERGSSLLESRNSEEFQGLSPLIFTEMETAVKQKYEMYRLRVEEQAERGLSNSRERRNALDQLEGRMLREKRAIDRCKQQYMRSVNQLKQNMLKMQNDNAVILRMGASSLRVRRSYSADSFILKSILEDVSFKNMDLELKKEREDLGLLLQGDFRRKGKIEEGAALTIPTSPPSVVVNNIHNSAQSVNCYEEDSESKLREVFENNSEYNQQDSQDPHVRVFEAEKDQLGEENLSYPSLQECGSCESLGLSVRENSFKEGENSRMVRQCSEQIQVEIQAILIWQITQEIYQRSRFWTNFKSMVENPYQFKVITDSEILTFLNYKLPSHFDNDLNMLQRINQKINPTSLEILRLIRDFDFEIDEYELVLPEEVFKTYRKSLEEQYSEKIAREQEREIIIQADLQNSMKELVYERGKEKRTKSAKFMSFERDLRIMYMKAVFNCYNELIIENKSQRSFMNGRSSIGPGELTLAIKQYNQLCDHREASSIMLGARQKIGELLSGKCCIPEFKNHRDLQLFQRQMNWVIVRDLTESEYKWVNYMDEVLQLWQQLSSGCVQELLSEAVVEIASLL